MLQYFKIQNILIINDFLDKFRLLSKIFKYMIFYFIFRNGAHGFKVQTTIALVSDYSDYSPRQKFKY